MTRQVFLDELLKKTKDAELIKFLDELISDKVEEEGKSEEQVIAGLNIDEIISTMCDDEPTAKDKAKVALTKVQNWFKDKFKRKEKLDNAPPTVNPIKKAIRWCKEKRIVSTTSKFFFTLLFAVLGSGLMLAGVGGFGFAIVSAIMLSLNGSSVAFILLTSGASVAVAGGLGVAGWAILRATIKGKLVKDGSQKKVKPEMAVWQELKDEDIIVESKESKETKQENTQEALEEIQDKNEIALEQSEDDLNLEKQEEQQGGQE